MTIELFETGQPLPSDYFQRHTCYSPDERKSSDGRQDLHLRFVDCENEKMFGYEERDAVVTART